MSTRQEQLTHLKQELEKARSVQSDFLPRTRSMTNLDVAVNCIPAEDIGGDICDIFEADHGRTAVVIGDVSGKGMSAGLLTGIVYGSVHASSWTESAFHHEDATEKLNDFLRRKTSADRFVSLFWGYYEPEASKFRYINAGHLPMLMIRRKGHSLHVERLEKGGPILGIIEWGNYQQGEVDVEEGDLLVLFSDGIVEAMNESHDLFGEQGILDAIRNDLDASPTEIQEKILNAVRAHVADAGSEIDDQTLVVARFQEVFTGISTTGVHEMAI